MENREIKEPSLGVSPAVMKNKEQNIHTRGEIPVLVDPDDVCRQLESVNLTEEDTDILLRDALQLNKILKEHLSKQQEDPPTKNRNNINNHRKKTQDGKKSTKCNAPAGSDLPPLDTKRGLSAAQMRIRPQNMGMYENKPASRSSQKSEASSAARGKKTASPIESKRRSKSATQKKAEWTDRW